MGLAGSVAVWPGQAVWQAGRLAGSRAICVPVWQLLLHAG